MVVSHQSLGSGRIVVVDEDHVIVDFASAREHFMIRDEAKKTLSRLDEQGLEARLFLAPEETRRWVDEAPLRLVAATLVDAGRGRAKTKDIRERLSPAVVDHETWNRWWGRVQNKLKDSPQFDYDAKKGTRLRSPANEVVSVSFSELPPPSKNTQNDRKPSSATTRFAEWVIWIQSEEPREMPRGQGPPDALISVINNMPETVTPRVVRRLADAIELRVLSPKNPTKSAPLFVESFVAGLYRWSESRTAQEIPVGEIATLLARLLEAAGEAKHEDVAKWLADYASKDEENAGAVANAVLRASQVAPDGAQRLVAKVHSTLDEPTRLAFWQHLLTFSPGQATKPPLEQWVKVLTPDERCEIISSLLIMVRDDDSFLAIGSPLRIVWRLADANQRYKLFDAIALSWLLRARPLPGTETIIREVSEALQQDDAEKVGSRVPSPWKEMVYSAARSEIERIREEAVRQMDVKDTRLRKLETELERTKGHAAFLQGENRKARREAELEITRDAINVLGIALQSLATHSVPKPQEISDVESRISLALLTLGVKQFGNLGETVTFDPAIHDANPSPAPGTPVKIIAPGLRYSRREDTPITLVKVQVQAEE